MNILRSLYVFLAITTAWAATNPDIRVDLGVGGADLILVGKTTSLEAKLIWPEGDFPKPAGSYAWSSTIGLEFVGGNTGPTVTVKGHLSELAKVTVAWAASGYDSPSASKNIKVNGQRGLPVGSITSFTGDMYSDVGNVFIPPKGKGAMSGTATDRDMEAGVIVNDTFTNAEAFRFSATHGTVIKTGHNSAEYEAPESGVLDVISLYARDDGTIYPDYEDFNGFIANKQVHVYQLTGVSVAEITEMQQFKKGIQAATFRPTEVYPGARPTLRYEVLNESDAVVFSETDTTDKKVFLIPEAGRYRFRISNVHRESETYTSKSYTFYEVTFVEDSIKFDWEKSELLHGVPEAAAAGALAAKSMADYAAIVGNVGTELDVAEKTTEARQAVAATEAAKTAELATYSAKLQELNGHLNDVELLMDADDVEMRIIEALLMTETDPVRRSALELEWIAVMADFTEQTAEYNRTLGAIDSVEESIEVAKKIRDAAKAVGVAFEANVPTASRLKNIASSVVEAATPYGVALDVLGIVGNGVTLFGAYGRYDALIDKYNQAHEDQEKYKEMLLAIKAGRKDPTLTASFTVKCVPAGIPFKFGGGPSWRTFSPQYLDNNAAHLTGLNGDIGAWDSPQSFSGETQAYSITAYGNLGYEIIRTDKGDDTLRIEAGNYDENQAIAAVKPFIDAEIAVSEAGYNVANDTLALLDTALTIASYFGVFFGLGFGIFQALRGGVAAASFAMQWVKGMWVSSDLGEQIRKDYP